MESKSSSERKGGEERQIRKSIKTADKNMRYWAKIRELRKQGPQPLLDYMNKKITERTKKDKRSIKREDRRQRIAKVRAAPKQEPRTRSKKDFGLNAARAHINFDSREAQQRRQTVDEKRTRIPPSLEEPEADNPDYHKYIKGTEWRRPAGYYTLQREPVMGYGYKPNNKGMYTGIMHSASTRIGKAAQIIPRENSREKVHVGGKREMSEENLTDYLKPEGRYVQRKLKRKFEQKPQMFGQAMQEKEQHERENKRVKLESVLSKKAKTTRALKSVKRSSGLPKSRKQTGRKRG